MKQVMTFAKAEQCFQSVCGIKETFSLEEGGEVPEMFNDLELEKGRYFWGYANLATPDKMGDKFTLDALTEISRTLTFAPYNKILINHDYEDIAIGTIVATKMDSFGLMILGKLNDVHRRAEEVWGSILNKSLDGFSMSGNMIKVVAEFDEATGEYVNVVLEATANEVTLTSLPVHPGASVMGAFRKSMQNANERFFRSFQDGKIAKKIGKYKKAKDIDKSMEEGDGAKGSGEEGISKEDQLKAEEAAAEKAKSDAESELEAEAKAEEEAKAKEEAEAKAKAEAEANMTEEEKAEAAKKAEEDAKAKEEEEKKKAAEEEAGKQAAAKKKKMTADEKLVEADKIILEQKKEIEELKTKLSAFEKAMKNGYKKAMNDHVGKNGVPFRKSKKSPADKDPTSGDSNSTPMLGWLRKN